MQYLKVGILITSLLITNASLAQQVSRQQAASIAQRYAKGQVLKVDASNTVYKVKVLQGNGRVIIVFIDRKTGKVKK